MPLLTRNTWVKITLVTLLCLLVCGGLLSCSNGCTSAINHATGLGGALFDGHQLPNVGGGTTPAQDVRDLEIDWIAGEVTIEVVPDAEADGTIAMEESTTGKMSDQDRMRWGMVGQKLVIASGYGYRGLWSCSWSSPKTSLVLRLPESTASSLANVELNTASGRYDLSGIGCEQLRASVASGEVRGEGLRASTLRLEMASGTADLRGSFSDRVDVDVASGEATIACEGQAPSRSSIDLASGTVTMQLPEDAGFTAAIERLSGSFSYDFPGDVLQNGNSYVRGDGSCHIDATMASGRMVLKALAATEGA